jgi:hypothetical protein
VDISAGKAGGTGINPSAVIDAANGKLLVVGEESAGIPAHTKSSLFRCNLDGSACTYVDISVGQLDSGFRPTALVDAANGKLLVIAGTSSSGPALYRCNLDGTSCSYAILTANLGPHLGSNPSALIDVEGGKLLVVAEDSSNSSRPALYRCNLDGSSCTYTDISVGRGALSGLSPSVALDPASRKVFVATMDGRLGLPDYALSLFANCP